jgi:predicted Zn-dependent peptidase
MRPIFCPPALLPHTFRPGRSRRPGPHRPLGELFFLLALLLAAGCARRTPPPAAVSSPPPAATAPAAGAAIPDRPEKLRFPPLQYEPPHPADYRVPLQAGPVAYVVPDRTLPLVNLVLYVRVGQYLEPADKLGLADMTGHLLARGGTASKTAEELEEELDFLAAQLGSSIGETQGTVSLNLLAKDLDAGLALLREVLTAPRFQEDKLQLYRQQMLQAMRQRNDDAADIEARERDFLVFGESFWANRLPTAATVNAIQREDLVAFHRRWFHPANFVVAASGDFDRAAMVARLERLFADWPFAGEIPPPIPTNTTFAAPGVYLVNKDVNQGRVSLLLPGVRRDDPDFFALTVMNRILGGGGFTSRIMNRVRSDEGLAYAASSALPGGVYYPLMFVASFQSKSRTVARATAIVLEEMQRIAREPVSEEELETEKRSLIETLPRAFTTKAQVAARFAEDEFTGRFAADPDYWKHYRARVAAVTREDVLRVARKLLTPERVVILVVGQKDEILLGHPDHPVRLPDLAGGRLVDVPLRDPLTLEPLRP